jgi:hypothetical protein
MRILDKIALNRLIAIITAFILGVLKIITANLPKVDEPVPPDEPTPPKKKRRRIFRKEDEDEK